jgi:hypothetical protein
MKSLKLMYRDLEMATLAALRHAIQESEYKSVHTGENAIKVSLFDYTEMQIINENLTFLDADGLHHSLFSEASLEDLIDIVSAL